MPRGEVGVAETPGTCAFPKEGFRGNASPLLFRLVYPSCKAPFGQQHSDPELSLCSPGLGSGTQQAASQTDSPGGDGPTRIRFPGEETAITEGDRGQTSGLYPRRAYRETVFSTNHGYFLQSYREYPCE